MRGDITTDLVVVVKINAACMHGLQSVAMQCPYVQPVSSHIWWVSGHVLGHEWRLGLLTAGVVCVVSPRSSCCSCTGESLNGAAAAGWVEE